MKPLDVSKATDPQWLVDTLYRNDPMPVSQPFDTLAYDVGMKPLGFFDDVVGCIGDGFSGDSCSDAGDAVVDTGLEVWRSITPSTISGSFDWNEGFFFTDSGQIFPVEPLSKLPLTQKTLYPPGLGGYGVKVKLGGSLAYAVESTFKPGLQMGVEVAVPGHDADTKFTLNVDSYMHNSIIVDTSLDVTLESAPPQDMLTGLDPKFESKLSKGGAFAKAVWSAAGPAILGDQDYTVPAGWRWVLWASQPAVFTFAVGPVPVVVTASLQLDLECGFQAKANIKSRAWYENTTTFKYSVAVVNGEVDQDNFVPPTFSSRTDKGLTVTAGGQLEVACSLIPRANVLMYDMAGVYSGLRGTMHAEAAYGSECNDKETSVDDYTPDGDVTAGVFLSTGVQVGALYQAPGASVGGASAVQFRKDFPLGELWQSPKSKLIEKSWHFPGGGLGYCDATCPDKQQNADETDVDCGGGCSSCVEGQKCNVNSECFASVCNNGVCSTDRCGDGLRSALETDVDCGGADMDCPRCADGQQCKTGSDCSSTYCAAIASGVAYGTCSDTHCDSGVKDGDEGGVDCGGSLCPKCAIGVAASSAQDCESGAFHGFICVETACDDGLHNGSETDVDCGGPDCAARCGTSQGCDSDSDCGVRVCDPTTKRCLLADGEGCYAGNSLAPGNPDQCHAQCSSGIARIVPWQQGGVTYYNRAICEAPSCNDGKKNGTETDVDCGGSACPRCAVGSACNNAGDCECQNGVCLCISGQCAPSSCTDGYKTGDETDIDCGGSCGSCPLLHSCQQDNDCLLGACGACGARMCCLPPSGLAAAYAFDGPAPAWVQNLYAPANVEDGSGQKQHGVGNPFGYVLGHNNSGAARFEGLGQGVDIGTIDLGDTFSIAAWVYIPSPSQTSANTLLTNAGGPPPPSNLGVDGFRFAFNSSGTEDLSLHLQTSDGLSSCNYATAASVLALDSWQHVVITVDRAALPLPLVSFYVNGVAVAGSGCVVPTFNTNLPLLIGRDLFGEYSVRGSLDDYRIYTRVLTPTEAASVANQ
jgi:hypothetical protein